MKLATVVDTSPLRLRRDGDTVAVAAVPTSVTVSNGDRVLCQIVDNLVYIIVRIQ